MKWTDEQQQVIGHSGSDLLVSAAAGSGKTAVLIARILRIITDPNDPVDVDRLLIVTFTKAAAAEMRGRLYTAILERAEAEPENARIRRQLKLLPQALICTIDSFCTYLLRNHFNEIDLDPAFRVGDETEMKLLQQDAVALVLEEAYAEASPEFVYFTESVSEGRSDKDTVDCILSLFNFSESAPWPDEWLDACIKSYEISSEEELEASPWYLWHLNLLSQKLKGYAAELDGLCYRCEAEAELRKVEEYYKGVQRDIRIAARFSSAEEAGQKLAAFDFGTAPRVMTKKLTDPKAYEPIKKDFGNLRDKVNAIADEVAEPMSRWVRHMNHAAVLAKELVRLTKRFREVFAEEKRKNSVVDFGDLEHFALKVLLKDKQPTETARVLRDRFREIMVDEYQDSNYVQETILKAVSDGKNMFMVGDMKQSIYRFRMARPELFVGKYREFLPVPPKSAQAGAAEEAAGQAETEGNGMKIELDRNFRSASSVLDGVNFFFRALMQEAVGGIDYDDKAALKAGRLPEEMLDRKGAETEFHVLETDVETDSDDDLTDTEWEARLAAAEIRKLMDSQFKVYDGQLKDFRPVRYSDIVILMRSLKNRDTVFQEQLENAGIPVYVASRSGYFESREVRLVLDLLETIDNPLNDIPLVSVMHSMPFSFSDDELAVLKSDYKKKEQGNGFMGAVNAFLAKPDRDPVLAEKTEKFLAKIEEYRELAQEIPLSSLLRYIYSDLKLETIITALPGGLRRQANLRFLITKAENFEKTSYHGIFHFIRYIDRLRSAALDEGEAGTANENDDVVRIMTVHKSKGLEFPVVFACGMGTGFKNKAADTEMHADYGVGLDDIDPDLRLKNRTLLKRIITEKNKNEEMGEELRILYVAFTRAREKLYILGCVKSLQKINEKYGSRYAGAAAPLTYTETAEAGNFMAMLLAAWRDSAPVKRVDHSITELTAGNMLEEGTDRVSRERQLEEAAQETDESRKLREKLHDTAVYPYIRDDLYLVKESVSVSYLKIRAHEELEEEAGLRPEQEHLFSHPDRGLNLDKGPDAIKAAELGTLYHTVMEHADPDRGVEEQLSEWENAGVISHKEKDTINPEKVRKFLTSPLGKRYAEARRKGRAFREKQFIMGMDAARVFPKQNIPADSGEMVMVQGIIDLYFEEDDGIVLADYKTDSAEDPEELNRRYDEQLRIYAEAIERMTGKKVKEKWFWSLYLDRAVKGPDDK